MNFEQITDFLLSQGLDFGIRLIGAILAWFVGRWLIHAISRLIKNIFAHANHMDKTLQQYLQSFISGILTIMLVLGILGMFGVQTTSIAALLAGAGLAIGTAWGGLLTHFAAGIFMQILRPLRVGDSVQAGGTTGVVTQIGLFTTTISTADGVPTIIGNNSVFSGSIQNFTAARVRRAECIVMLDHNAPVGEAIVKFNEAVKAIPNVLETPAPSIQIIEFPPEGIKIAIRPYTSSQDYTTVNATLQEVIYHTCSANHYELAGKFSKRGNTRNAFTVV